MKKLTFEFLSIVIAVVLAMGLTEWRQDVLNRNQAEISFQNILSEIDDNIKELQEDSANVARNVEEMGIWIGADKKGRDSLGLDIGFDLSFLTSSAWEVAQLNQSLTFLENHKVQDLATVYEAQEFYERAGNNVFDVMTEVIKISDRNDPEYEATLKALRFKMRLTYGAIVAYLGVAKVTQKIYTTASD